MSISLVQQTGGLDSSGASAGVSVAYGAAPTAGNMLYAVIASGNGAANTNITAFTDTNTNSWTKIIDNNTNHGDGLIVQVAYNCKGGASTVSFSDAGFASYLVIGEVSGLATAAAFDQQSITEPTGSNPAGGTTPTLSVANEFILAIVLSGTTQNGAAYTIGSGYSNFLAETGQWIQGGVKSNIVASTAGVTASFAGGAATQCKVAILTFQAVALPASAGDTLYRHIIVGDGMSRSEVAN